MTNVIDVSWEEMARAYAQAQRQVFEGAAP